MLLKEQNESICYPAATVEDGTYTNEQKLYDISNSRRIDKTTTGATQSSFGSKLYRVHGGLTGEKVGLGIVLKVMAGDQVKINAESYYTMPGGGPASPTGSAALSELLSAFVGGTAITTTHTGLSTSDVTGIGSNSTSIPSFLSGNSEGSNNARAFVNYILFDDQMKYISGGADPVNTGGGYKNHTAFVSSPVSVSKSGYIYVYVSNESNFPVYFDNLAVTHTPGAILEENSYYPFGLAMKGISSQALSTTILNKYKYNGKEEQRKEFSDGTGLDLLDYGARMYDAQIGRFFTIDQMCDKKTNISFSPYSYVYDNPLKFIDPDGKDGILVIEGNTITVKANIYLYGKDATKQNAQNVQNVIMKTWSKQKDGKDWTYKDPETGKVYTVKFDVKVDVYNGKEKQDPFIIPDAWNPASRNNYIEADNSVSRSKVGGNEFTSDEGVWNTGDSWESAHEFAHLLGLKDRYVDDDNGNSVADPGWSGNIMATYGGDVEQKNIDGLAGFVVKKYNKAKKAAEKSNDHAIKNIKDFTRFTQEIDFKIE